MNLRNGQITVRELLANPQVWMILQQEYPNLYRHPMIKMAQGMSLNQLLWMAKGKIPQNQINHILEELRRA